MVRISSICASGSLSAGANRGDIKACLVHALNARFNSSSSCPASKPASIDRCRPSSPRLRVVSKAISAETRLRGGNSALDMRPSSSRKYRCDG